jgi:hypothetical protein
VGVEEATVESSQPSAEEHRRRCRQDGCRSNKAAANFTKQREPRTDMIRAFCIDFAAGFLGLTARSWLLLLRILFVFTRKVCLPTGILLPLVFQADTKQTLATGLEIKFVGTAIAAMVASCVAKGVIGAASDIGSVHAI